MTDQKTTTGNQSLPTEVGHYWWREDEKKEWYPRRVEKSLSRGLICWGASGWEAVESIGGQWSRIPKPDAGQELYGMVSPSGVVITADQSLENCQGECDYYNQREYDPEKGGKYTVRKVRIFPAQEVTG